MPTVKPFADNEALSACNELDRIGQGALVTVSFETVDGRIYVSAMVNRQGPYRFALDTGASGMGRADASLVAELSLPLAQGATSSDGVSTAQVDTVLVDSIALGGLERTGLEVIARDYRARVSSEAAFCGILGRAFFADGLLVIDYPARMVTFSTARHLTPDMAGAVSYERAFRVPVTIGGKVVEGNLDTGANVNFVVPAALYAKIGGGAPQGASRGGLMNTQVSVSEGTIDAPIAIGGHALSGGTVKVSPDFPELLLGAHALENAIVMIDQRHNAVALCPR